QAGTYHQLGRVAQERRQWGEAEKHYREALRIYVEFHDRYMQGSTYHNLGRVAQEQRQWDEAGKNYREALRIFAEFNDQHSLAVTLRNIVSMAPERPGIPDWVAEILGVTADEVQKLFEAIRPDPGEPPPESAAAAPE
ncbi:MAG: tetratricopeptide repeat protein, partial [Acidobacteriia bacterium]|nr:tetratricopeptide repeat protein [Terriglobia bacterium]